MRLKRTLGKLRSDLGFQLLVLYLLFVVPVVVGALIFQQIAGQRIQRDIENADLALAQAIALETDTFMEAALKSVEQLGGYDEVIEADVEEMGELFRQVYSVRPDVNLIYRLGADGIMLYHYPVDNPAGAGSTLGRDFSFRGYFQQALERRTPLVSKGRISPTTDQPVATAVMPLWTDEGEFLGLVATNIMLQSLSETLVSIIEQQTTEGALEVLIIDATGQVIAHSDPSLLLADLNLRLPEVSGRALAGGSGNVIFGDGNGEEKLYSYVSVPSAGWGVIVSRPTSVAFATARGFHHGVLLMIGVFLGIGLFFWLGLSRRVLRPIEHLAAHSQKFGQQKRPGKGKGHPLQAYARRADQLGHLIRSFTRMEQAVQARLNELSTLLKTSAAVVSTLDSKAVLDRILKQVEHLLDIEMCAIVALDEAQNLFRVQASRGLSIRYAEKLTISPDERASVTMRAIRSGEPVQISDTEDNPTFAAFRPRARAEGYRSILAIPLNIQHAPPAALLVYGREPHVFGENELNLLSSFANHAAMAIQNAALFAQSDAQLQKQTRRLEAMVQSLEDGLILEDLHGHTLYANRRMSELTGMAPEAMSGAPSERVIEGMLSHAEDEEAAREAVKLSLEEGGAEWVEIALRYSRVGKRYVRLKGFSVRDSADLSIGRGLIVQDVTKSRELDRMKSSLVSTVSHELRTPLAAIKGYASTLLATDVDWDIQAQEEFLEIISAEADRLGDLVSNLLDMSRIEAGSLVIAKTECDLEELILRGAEGVHPDTGGRLELQLPQNLPKVCADPQRMQAVFRNLIENAVKYAGEGSPIFVRAAQRENEVVVWVEDEGPGIPDEQSSEIFKSFSRVENGLTRQTPGAGLGLAICQGFVRAHGGEIWLEPRERGTCVAFTLPLDEGGSGGQVDFVLGVDKTERKSEAAKA